MVLTVLLGVVVELALILFVPIRQLLSVCFPYQMNLDNAQRGKISTAQRYTKKRNKLCAISRLAVSIQRNCLNP